MLLHFDDATSLTGARLWRRDKLIILYGLHHTLELQCVGGPDNDPIDMEALGCTHWELKITPSLASPSLILASATYEENIAVGDTLSFDFSTATQEMYRYVAGESNAPGVFELLGFEGSSDVATVAIQFPLILRTTTVNPMPPTLSTAIMNEIQRASEQVNADINEAQHLIVDIDATALLVEQDAQAASASATLSESYAKGGTGTREGEDTDNAKYYKEQADQDAQGASTAKSQAEQARTDAITAKDQAVDARAQAVQASTQANQAKEQAAQSAQDAATAKNQASQARDDAYSARNQAVTAKDDAVMARNDAVDAKDAALQAKADTLELKNQAGTYRNEAVSARDASVNAKNQSVAAKDAAAISEQNAAGSATAAGAQASAALNARNQAVSAKEDAVTAAANASVWTEGTDQQVQQLGGEHSAKGWADIATGYGLTGVNVNGAPATVSDHVAEVSVPTKLSQLSSDATHRTVTDTEKQTWNGKSDFSGSYNDLTDKPTIPTVGNGRVTIMQGGASKGSFTMNQSSDVTITLDAGGGGGGGGDAAWGDITGDISSQTDLMEKFGEYIPTDEKGAANGVAELDANGTVPDGQLPKMGTTQNGIASVWENGGLNISISGERSRLYVTRAENADITARSSHYKPIVPFNLNYAVTAALTDQNHITLTAEQQATAQEVLGVPAPIIGDTAPTTATVGKLMQQYLNSTTGKTYHCTAITNTGTEAEPVWEYTWTDDINEKGGTFANGLQIGTYSGVNSTLVYLNRNFCVFQLTPSYARIRNRQISIEGNTHSDGYFRILDMDGGSNAANYLYNNGMFWAKKSYQYKITEIPAATTSYNLAEGVQSHTPAEASTYVFPAVTDTTRTHRIRLILDFTTVQTYAFEDSNGNALAPLFTPTIAAGDVYEFDCEYSVAKSQWLIWPHKQGAVSDDYVMQSEVGAANGVAGLDANGKVPRAELPIAGSQAGEQGAVITNGYYGVQASGNGTLQTNKATDADISGRDGSYKPIVPSNLNYAVAAALTDANKISLTDAQKASAQDTIGAYGTLHLDSAPTTSTVGAFGQRGIVDSTGKAYTCTAVTVDETDPQNPVTTYTWREDLPLSCNTNAGIVWTGYSYGLVVNSTGRMETIGASTAQIDAKSDTHRMIVPSNLDYAVRSVLPNVTEIPAATSEYTLVAQDATTNNHCCTYEHAPQSAPTYTLPAVSDATVHHEIMLTVRFSTSVLTYAFEDSQGNAITPLPLAGTIADGSVVAFRCTWEALLNQWVIMPVMLGTYQEVEP